MRTSFLKFLLFVGIAVLFRLAKAARPIESPLLLKNGLEGGRVDDSRVQPSRSNTYMDCGTAPVCGVLTLETGWGAGAYGHESPAVHGLWPQVPPYGNSACLRPQKNVPAEYSWDHPERLQCYNTELPGRVTKEDYAKEYGFETHEWAKHGVCAGMDDSDDFLDTVCGLSKTPLEVMKNAENNGAENVESVAEALKIAGFPVYYVDAGNTKQIELSLCAGKDRAWRFAMPEDFDELCGSDEPRPSPSPSPPSPLPAEECVRMKHGPPCSSDSDCDGVPGCVRCAHSGFCTDVKLHVVVNGSLIKEAI